MLILNFVVQLAGATLLLLFAVRMVRTGIERALGSSFRRVLTRSQAAFPAALVGVGLAAILQSSAAVAVLASSFVGSSSLSFGVGLSVVLGADLGSAIVTQILSLQLDWLVPLLLACGGILFLKFDAASARQAGRVLIGIALILIALGLLRETVAPIKDSAFLPQLTAILQRDFLTAFLVGAMLTFVMHSAVAVILMIVTLVAIDALPFMVGISLMLGANLGSALLPVWFTRGMNAAARRVPLANLMIRGTAALMLVVIVNRSALLDVLPSFDNAQAVILTHIAFNGVLLLVIPMRGLFYRWTRKLLPDASEDVRDEPVQYRSVLDGGVVDTPGQALICIRREILRMLQIAEEMIQPVIEMFERFDTDRMKTVIATDIHLNNALDGIRHYASTLPQEKLKSADKKTLRHLMEFAIAIEAAGDLVAKTMLPLAQSKAKANIQFSKEGFDEIQALHDRVIANIALASNVLISGDVNTAGQLLQEKNEFSRKQRNSRKRHLKRLAAGRLESLESSDLHLETGLAFKEFNSQIATVAYPILSRGGQLLDSRLIADGKD
ncbi:Na/Pi cotransporter family protein [Alphaproteobacteria bacterium]|jgi:phosphate:Na+ symporter|nr:Na/Pi cotransporter family protein [Alphaproteobacteria bacterium]